jgi:aspartyl/asparaginyl-tRNA synthetase
MKKSYSGLWLPSLSDYPAEIKAFTKNLRDHPEVAMSVDMRFRIGEISTVEGVTKILTERMKRG